MSDVSTAMKNPSHRTSRTVRVKERPICINAAGINLISSEAKIPNPDKGVDFNKQNKKGSRKRKI
jgi:hypothetical protein